MKKSISLLTIAAMMLGFLGNSLFAEQTIDQPISVVLPQENLLAGGECCEPQCCEPAYSSGCFCWTGVGLLLAAIGGAVAIIITHNDTTTQNH